ncbi:MAG: glycerate kinase [Candidatus Helarchaeota archaeon]|nr:glycerate kinase [Candidatus Helarchaeota archaeon]
MIIKNYQSLISRVTTDQEVFARKSILELLDVGINSVLPRNLIPKLVKLKNGNLYLQNYVFKLSQINHIYVVGAGKASGAMAEALEPILRLYITEGLINIPKGTKQRCKTQIIQLNEANHPIPSENGIKGTRKIVEILKKAQENDLIISLISGGGSALLPLPTSSIGLDQLQALNRTLIKSGASIQEINTVRKHCSQIKGGQMVKYGLPATMVTLIISDVIGNPIDSIASGPTVPDPTTFDQAIRILKKYDVWETLAHSIRNHFKNGIKGNIPETPKPSDEIFQKTHTIIIGDIKLACESIKKAAIQKEFQSKIYSYEIIGEARDVGKNFIQIIKEKYSKSLDKESPPVILITGGETTVTVKGNGVGGRCQELGLAILSELGDLPGMIFAALGTDGIDGFTDAAGVIIDKQSVRLMNEKCLDHNKFLNNNDSYNFFKELGDSLIFTGPTGTNVNDLMLIGIF